MTKSLPPRPNLEQYRNQAKDLLKAHRSGDPDAVARVRAHLPTAPPTPNGELKLSDAQWIVAREHGFASWPRFKRHIELRATDESARRHVFVTEVAWCDERAAGLHSVLQTGQQHVVELVRAYHPHYADASDAEIRAAEFTLDDARLVHARQHGFDTWEAFAAYIEALANGEAEEPFIAAFQALQQGDDDRFRALLRQHPELVNARGTNGNSLLNLAGSFRRLDAARALIDAGADVDLPNDKGWTPLHGAAYGNHWQFAELFLDAGASPELMAHGDGGTPLAQACFWGHAEFADRLVARCGVIPANLRIAAATGSADLVRTCFNEDGSLKRHAFEGRQFHRPHSGFPPWIPTDDPQEVLDEALVWAARSNRVNVMPLLVERGARVDADPYRGTPLAWAAFDGCVEAVAWLLDHGAEIHGRSTFGGFGHGEGVMAHHLAANTGRRAVIDLLMDRGADVALHDGMHGGAAWGWAAFHGHPVLSNHILERAAPTNIFAAATRGDVDQVRALLEADPSLANAENSGRRPIHDAASRGHDPVIHALHAAGADLNARNRGGQTPVDLATVNRHGAAARLLRHFGGRSAEELAVDPADEPPITDLRYFWKRANRLLELHRAGDTSVVNDMRWGLPEWRHATSGAMMDHTFGEHEACQIVAQKHRFESWGQLVQALDELHAGRLSHPRFDEAVNALIDGDLETLQRLLAEHPELATTRSWMNHHGTLLHYAASNGVEDERQRAPRNLGAVTAAVLAAGAEPDALCNSYGGGNAQTPLSLGVTSGHPEHLGVSGDLVRALVAGGAKLDGLDDNGLPLASALAFGNRLAAEALAECGARIDNIVSAAGLGRTDLVAELLREENGMPAADHGVWTQDWLRLPPDPQVPPQFALIQAAAFGHAETVALLLDRGVDPNAMPKGEVAFHGAAFHGRREVCELLLQRGADPNIRDARWHSPAWGWAGHAGHRDLRDLIVAVAAESDLFAAVAQRDIELVLAQLDAKPESINDQSAWTTPLDLAVTSGQLDVAALLLERGADPSLPNREDGRLPLDHAEDGSEMAALLRRHGAKTAAELKQA